MVAAGSNAGQNIYQIEEHQAKAVQVTAVPYYANLNRGPVDMTVWVPLQA